MLQREFGEALRRRLQLLQQAQRLFPRQAARFGVICRTGQQDVPRGQQRRAEEALTVAVVVLLTGRLVGQRQRHFLFDQRAGGRFFLAFTGFSTHHQPEFGDALLQQLAHHQCLGRQKDRLVAALGGVILQFLGDGLGRDRHPVDPHPRPLLLAAGDQQRLAGGLLLGGLVFFFMR